MGVVVRLQLGCGSYSREASVMKLLQHAGGYYSRAATIGKQRLIEEIRYGHGYKLLVEVGK